MPGTSKPSDAPGSSKQSISPFQQQYRTVIQKSSYFSEEVYMDVQRMGWEFGTFRWGSVSFDVTLERKGSIDAEFLLKVACNRRGSDPHWLCEFSVSVNAELDQGMIASKDDNELVIPIRRLPANPAGGHDVDWAIRMNSWSGIFPPLLHSFSTKTDISDATLIVEDKPLYVSRALLALHSTFFNTLFYDDKFPDAAKDEFPLSDVSYDDMVLYLQLVSPNIADDTPEEMNSMDAIEAMLTLAERFGNDTLTREMEQYLMGEKGGKIEGLTPARVLLLADRFRLSAPASHIMRALKAEIQRVELGDTEEYWQLSAELKAAILDASMRRPRQQPDASEAAPRSSTTITSMRDWFLASDDDDLQMRIRLHRPVVPSHRPDPRFARRRRSPPPASSSTSSSNTASDTSFETFTADLARLATAMNCMGRSAVTRDRMDSLGRSLNYLRRLSREDYQRLLSSTRTLMHRNITRIVTGNNAGECIEMLNEEVDMIRQEMGSSRGASSRSVEGSARKRMRMRDYVLTDSP